MNKKIIVSVVLIAENVPHYKFIENWFTYSFIPINNNESTIRNVYLKIHAVLKCISQEKPVSLFHFQCKLYVYYM